MEYAVKLDIRTLALNRVGISGRVLHNYNLKCPGRVLIPPINDKLKILFEACSQTRKRTNSAKEQVIT